MSSMSLFKVLLKQVTPRSTNLSPRPTAGCCHQASLIGRSHNPSVLKVSRQRLQSLFSKRFLTKKVTNKLQCNARPPRDSAASAFASLFAFTRCRYSIFILRIFRSRCLDFLARFGLFGCYIWYSEEGPGRAAAPPVPHRCTKCNSPPLNGQCTYFILFDVPIYCESIITIVMAIYRSLVNKFTNKENYKHRRSKTTLHCLSSG